MARPTWSSPVVFVEHRAQGILPAPVDVEKATQRRYDVIKTSPITGQYLSLASRAVGSASYTTDLQTTRPTAICRVIL